MTIKKIAALLLAVVMVFAITAVSASADNSNGYGGDYGIVNANLVRFRTTTSASSDRNVLCLLNKGDVVRVSGYTIASGYTWAKSTIEEGPESFIGSSGYVATDFLTLYQV